MSAKGAYMDVLSGFLGRNGFLPHGTCFTWTPGVLWTMVGSDAVIAAAYFSIPLAIISFVRRRGDAPGSSLPWLFSGFIFACGLTHVMDIWTIWQPDYGLQALSKLATAVISLLTALVLWRLIPQALKIPSVARLQSVIAALESEARQRRSAEDRLVDIQQSLALTLASIGAGFIATDRQGHVTRMNAVAESLLGWPESEACGRSLWEVFQRDDRPAAYLSRNPVDLMIEQGTSVDQAHHVVATGRGGQRTPIEVKAGLTRDDDGTVRGIAIVFRDETRQLRAQADASQLAAIVESSEDAIVSKTLDGRITSWNGGAQTLFGYSAEEAIGQPVQMLFPPERIHEEMRIVSELAHGVRVAPFNTVRRAKDGRLIDVSVTISPIRDGRNRIVGASKIARDVSAQRRAEAALRNTEARLRFTLEAALIGDWDLDLSSGQIQRSLRHDRCLGHAELQPDWRFDRLLQQVHEDDRDLVRRRFETALAAGSDWTVECRVVWPDGSLHWIRLQGSMQQQAGGPTHMLGIVTDITERRLAEQTRLTAQRLEAENREILAASRLKSQFLANMSHELRTPLNAIIGFADLLHAGRVAPDSPKFTTFLGHIGSSGRHLLQLINDVLDLSKVESGKFEFFPEPVDLAQLVRETGDVLHTALQHKRIHFGVEIDASLGALVLDPARLKQALYNYLSNAIKFTPEGGHVTVRARAEGDSHFRIEVEDTGIGIAEADLARLFVEFQQLDGSYSKQHQGTGLGLALTRRLVHAQGGSVGVRSAPGQGSTFHLVLPRQPAAEAAAAPAPAPGLAPPRWLVVEDDLPLQTQLLQGLVAAGHQADAATSGEQALQRASSTAYDAITLDLLLPDNTGLALLASIRSRGPSSETPVRGVTLPAGSGGAAAFAIADVLGKPIRATEVVAALARFRLPEPRRANVLVIDDDPLALDLMQATLQGMGISAVCRLDGRQALRELEEHRPDAIVLDLMMPVIDGFAVLDALRRMPAWAATPVYIWTSMVLSDEEYERLKLTAQAILGKGGGGVTALLDSLKHRPLAVGAGR
jgi:PAS domain S-box-containing protein